MGLEPTHLLITKQPLVHLSFRGERPPLNGSGRGGDARGDACRRGNGPRKPGRTNKTRSQPTTRQRRWLRGTTHRALPRAAQPPCKQLTDNRRFSRLHLLV